VAFCRVTYRDIEGIDHSVEVEAESLYEAVAKAVQSFRRDDCWALNPPGPGCHFSVKALKDAPVTYTISLSKVQEFAQHGTARGPQDVMRKNRIKELLGLR
jgi:hypothetical protein